MGIQLLFWLSLHFDTGVELMEILLLFSLALLFDTGVEDSWKFLLLFWFGTTLRYRRRRLVEISIVILVGTTLRYRSRRLMEILLSF